MSPVECTVCSNAPGSTPAPCSVALTSLTLWRTVSSMLSSCTVTLQPWRNLAPSCADCDLVLSIAVDKVLSLALGVLSSLLVWCCIHLLTPLTPNRIYHYVQCSQQDGPSFTGSNWQQWHTAMQAYLRAQGQWFIYGTACPNEDHDTWDEHNEKALGNITLHVSPSIQVTISHLTMVKEVWEHLKENHGAPSIGSAYAELSCLLSTTILTGSHPAPTITKMLSHFAYLKDTGFEFQQTCKRWSSSASSLLLWRL